jgi:hypothetical protein
MCGAVPPLPPSWHGAQLKKITGIALPFTFTREAGLLLIHSVIFQQIRSFSLHEADFNEVLVKMG